MLSTDDRNSFHKDSAAGVHSLPFNRLASMTKMAEPVALSTSRSSMLIFLGAHALQSPPGAGAGGGGGGGGVAGGLMGRTGQTSFTMVTRGTRALHADASHYRLLWVHKPASNAVPPYIADQLQSAVSTAS